MRTTNTPLRIALVGDQGFVREALSVVIATRTPHSVVLEVANDRGYGKLFEIMGPPDVTLVDLTQHPEDGIARIVWLGANQPTTKPLACGHMLAKQWVRRALVAGSRGYVALNGALDEVPLALEQLWSGVHYSSPLVLAVREEIAATARERGKVQAAISPRELEVLQLVFDAAELSYKRIADKLHIGSRTVESHMRSLYQKLGVKTRTGVLLIALRSGLLEL